jgi:MFS family permease
MKQVLLITTVCSAICTSIYLLISSQHAPKKPQETKETENKESPKTIPASTRKRLLAWSILYASLIFVTQTGRTLIAPFLQSFVSTEEFYVGLFGSINFAGVAVIGLLTARLGDRWGKIDSILVCLLMYAVTVEVIMAFPNPAFLLFMAFFWGGAITYGALIASAIGAIAPEASRGRWISIPLSSSMIAAVIAPYVSGYLYESSPYLPFLVSLIAVIPVTTLALTKSFNE